MLLRSLAATWAIVAGTTVSLMAADPPRPPEVQPSNITWKKIVVDPKFRSEGVAVADINRDGKLNVVNGELWYEAPDWKPHEIRKPGEYGDGLKGYSQSFAVWADDLNQDGWPDVIVIGFPGAPCYWYENPKNASGHWKRHEIWHSACNETPQYVDLFGTGKRVLVMGWQPKGKEREGQMAWFEPNPSDPTKLWIMHPISEPSVPEMVVDGKKIPGKEIPGTFRFAHGLGVGDINGDGRKDVIIPQGWWEQPAQVTDAPWKWHPAPLGEPAADMYAIDLDGDNKPDVVSSSAHKFGIWAFKQRPGKEGEPTFIKEDLFPKLVSETHAMCYADINGDGLKDLITGKRWWSHGRAEPGADWPAVIYWFEAKKDRDGIIRFIPHEVDNASGIGTQFEVADINGDGKLDIIVSNKRGTHILLQTGDKAELPRR